MMPIAAPRAGSIVLALLSLLLASCLLAPGKFTSSLDIHKDGRFSFAYTGEIHMLVLSKLANEMSSQGSDKFEPSSCFGNPGPKAPPPHGARTAVDAAREEAEAAAAEAHAAMKERPCTPAELAEQRRVWEEQRSETADKRRRDAESMKALLGGIDPSNPKAAEELAQRLRRQAGWKRVDYKGDGLFDVDFAITGRLDHDFTFPTIERFPMANAFVQIALRNDGTVRVDAPGFSPSAAGGPLRGMMEGTAAKGASGPTFPEIDGHFTLRTDGAILANNTDEGPQPDPAGQKLDWIINLRTPAAPTALIRLAP